MGARAQEGARQLRALVDHVLAVVEHHEHVTFGKILAQRIDGSCTAPGSKTEYASGLGRDFWRGGSCGKIDEPHAVEAPGDVTPSDFGCQPRLSHSPRSGQREKPASPKRLGYALEISGPSDERGKWGRNP